MIHDPALNPQLSTSWANFSIFYLEVKRLFNENNNLQKSTQVQRIRPFLPLGLFASLPAVLAGRAAKGVENGGYTNGQRFRYSANPVDPVERTRSVIKRIERYTGQPGR